MSNIYQAKTYTDSQRLSLRSKINNAGTILAPYWAIGRFVHHNPLHEIENLHFEEAAQRGTDLLGANAFLDVDMCRKLHDKGRISSDCINEVLPSTSDSITVGTKEVSRKDISRALLVKNTNAPSYESLGIITERDKDYESIKKLSEKLNPILEPLSIEERSEKWVSAHGDNLADIISLSQWCDLTFGTKLNDTINDELIRWCAAFLDEGQAAWEMPLREEGFLGVWRKLSADAPCPRGFDSKVWHSTINSLPESAEDCILAVLDDLKIPEEKRQSYLSLQMSSLPGWFAYIKWRTSFAEQQWQVAYPTDMAECIAIRLVCEQQLIKQYCSDYLEIDGNYDSIKEYMNENQLVYYMQSKRVDNKVPEIISQKVTRQWQRKFNIDSWKKLAQDYVHLTKENYKNIDGLAAAWRLVKLANYLEAPAKDLADCSDDTLKKLLSWVDEFPESDHGIVWLQAMEKEYQDDLIGSLSDAVYKEHKVISENNGKEQDKERPNCQAMFCIDVRSEPFRKRFEEVGNNETIGFAGFFICFIKFQALGAHHETDQFPVVMKARNIVREVARPYESERLERYRTGASLVKGTKKLLSKLKENFITPFVTVESLGWFYSFPLFLKTLATAPYQSFTQKMKESVESTISTTLTVDKLPEEEAIGIVISNQVSIIRRALEDQFNLKNPDVPALLVESLQKAALHEEDYEEQIKFIQEKMPGQSKEKIESFITDLRDIYHINPRGRSSRLERVTRTGFTVEEQVFTVETALRMTGLTSNFGRIVLICAHGSSSENNPFESALDCGACGGNEGQSNSRSFAAMANKRQIREILKEKGIEIPEDTHFLPGQIDTTTDVVELFDLEDVPPTHRLDLERLRSELKEASRLTSFDRCKQFPELSELSVQEAADEVLERSMDWSQVRPEWGLSGNASFIIARRQISQDIDLESRAFLHSYDYLTDPEGKLLEVIMTAPQVVTQWINMEHYFSVVDNYIYGCESKIYHNVVGHVGIMFGTESDLRTGLPWQTVGNGELPYHMPLRLTTIIEAPRKTLEEIISRHDLLKRFYYNEWVHLICLEREEGRFYRYTPDGDWEAISEPASQKEAVTS